MSRSREECYFGRGRQEGKGKARREERIGGREGYWNNVVGGEGEVIEKGKDERRGKGREKGRKVRGGREVL